VASKNGLIAAAGPDVLVVATTKSTHEAFHSAAEDNGVVTDFHPDITLSVPQLRHVVFSSGEDFLVVSGEREGGLAVYKTPDLVQKKTEPALQLDTEHVAVRALLPNPAPEYERFVAVVLDSGKLLIADVSAGETTVMHPGNVCCAAWSVKGKAVVAGLDDGTAIIYSLSTGQTLGTIPRPPEVTDAYAGKSQPVIMKTRLRIH
jgi:nucleoporin NUP159